MLWSLPVCRVREATSRASERKKFLSLVQFFLTYGEE